MDKTTHVTVDNSPTGGNMKKTEYVSVTERNMKTATSNGIFGRNKKEKVKYVSVDDKKKSSNNWLFIAIVMMLLLTVVSVKAFYIQWSLVNFYDEIVFYDTKHGKYLEYASESILEEKEKYLQFAEEANQQSESLAEELVAFQNSYSSSKFWSWVALKISFERVAGSLAGIWVSFVFWCCLFRKKLHNSEGTSLM